MLGPEGWEDSIRAGWALVASPGPALRTGQGDADSDPALVHTEHSSPGGVQHPHFTKERAEARTLDIAPEWRSTAQCTPQVEVGKRRWF